MFGARSRLRTHDPLLTRQVLYQLSYTSMTCCFRLTAWRGG
uniref:Uncharacterized protein n=1 Tax=Salmonella phage vB_SEnST11_KE22 TaxID=3161173 RepID=A0AAU8GIC6_9CAUD